MSLAKFLGNYKQLDESAAVGASPVDVDWERRPSLNPSLVSKKSGNSSSTSSSSNSNSNKSSSNNKSGSVNNKSSNNKIVKNTSLNNSNNNSNSNSNSNNTTTKNKKLQPPPASVGGQVHARRASLASSVTSASSSTSLGGTKKKSQQPLFENEFSASTNVFANQFSATTTNVFAKQPEVKRKIQPQRPTPVAAQSKRVVSAAPSSSSSSSLGKKKILKPITKTSTTTNTTAGNNNNNNNNNNKTGNQFVSIEMVKDSADLFFDFSKDPFQSKDPFEDFGYENTNEDEEDDDGVDILQMLHASSRRAYLSSPVTVCGGLNQSDDEEDDDDDDNDSDEHDDPPLDLLADLDPPLDLGDDDDDDNVKLSSVAEEEEDEAEKGRKKRNSKAKLINNELPFFLKKNITAGMQRKTPTTPATASSVSASDETGKKPVLLKTKAFATFFDKGFNGAGGGSGSNHSSTSNGGGGLLTQPQPPQPQPISRHRDSASIGSVSSHRSATKESSSKSTSKSSGSGTSKGQRPRVRFDKKLCNVIPVEPYMQYDLWWSDEDFVMMEADQADLSKEPIHVQGKAKKYIRAYDQGKRFIDQQYNNKNKENKTSKLSDPLTRSTTSSSDDDDNITVSNEILHDLAAGMVYGFASLEVYAPVYSDHVDHVRNIISQVVQHANANKKKHNTKQAAVTRFLSEQLTASDRAWARILGSANEKAVNFKPPKKKASRRSSTLI